MKLKKYLDRGLIQEVEISHESLATLYAVVERDLKDAQIREVSADRRFATAYSAGLTLASYAIRCQGYRVTGKGGHHMTTLQVAEKIIGPESKEHLRFLDLCRRKRNKLDYDLADIVSQVEVSELIKSVKKFQKLVIARMEMED